MARSAADRLKLTRVDSGYYKHEESGCRAVHRFSGYGTRPVGWWVRFPDRPSEPVDNLGEARDRIADYVSSKC